ncbi:helix-turn-helix domain-containing protein, partial [Methylocella sp.]|uniref:helix-turn-helix domain-containing protein n=1 Tax=Methylocella sp. TaxID=1978226 RepID=UPI003C1AFAE9
MKDAPESKEHSTRLSILAVAERLFAEIGFEKTTVADLARELRMSPANVYRFFSAKAEINEAVGRRLLRAIEAAGEEI